MFLWNGVLLAAVIAGLTSCFLYVTHRKGDRSPVNDLVVITADSQATVEWWVRSYMFWSWMHGRSCHCTCVDLGSTDDTLAILERLTGHYMGMEVKYDRAENRALTVEQLVPERLWAKQPIVIDLRHPGKSPVNRLLHSE